MTDTSGGSFPPGEVAGPPVELRVSRRRASIVMWTSLGAAALVASLLSLTHPVVHVAGGPIRLGPWPTPGVIGALLIVHVQLVYATRLRLVLDRGGMSFRNLLGTRRLAWSELRSIETVSALTPAGRGGNMSGLRLRTTGDDMFIPDVFGLQRDALRALMLRQARSVLERCEPRAIEPEQRR